MIQIFVDGVLAYDSRKEGQDLVGLKVTTGLNVGGSAEITMPPEHPAYDLYISHRSVVTIYRDGELRFRGRSLYPTDDFYGQRKITCEGELCFLRDAVNRPYSYTSTPQKIFRALIRAYNEQVESFKQFQIGTVTIPDETIEMTNEDAEPVLTTLEKLMDRCGGYIVFTDATDGSRVINWHEALTNTNGQRIEFGENLLDYSRTGADTAALATGLVPYGAKDTETKKRITIESVNDGKDYIIAEDARKIRGTIMAPVKWDDITTPAELLKKAKAYLAECKLFITSLSLTALDLSYMDRDIDSFAVGDIIRVISHPHGVDEDFELTQMTEDLLTPAKSSITLGKKLETLTGMDERNNRVNQSTIAVIKKELSTSEATYNSKIETTKQSIILECSKTYATKDALDDLEQDLTSKIEMSAGKISLSVSGSLGSEASIVLDVNGNKYNETLDLTAVREAFANDTSNVVISGGTIAFHSNTLIVNSTNLQVSADGTITATNANLSGRLTTLSGSYKSVLQSGALYFYWDDAQLGYIGCSGSSNARGLSFFADSGASFISFTHDAEGDGTYTGAYVINYGMNPGGYTERHLFYGTGRFTGRVVFLSTADFPNASGIRIANNDSTLYYVLRVDASNNCYVGNDYVNLYLRGKAVYLHNSGAVVTSDSRMKNSIEELPEAYVDALDKLTPVRFKYNDGSSGRYHVGFIAQEVEEALSAVGLDSRDFGGFVDLDGDGKTLGIAYHEFIGLLHQKIRRLESRIIELEEASA